MTLISKLTRRTALAIAALSICASASAQPSSTKPIRLVVPFGPGGVADLTARTVAQKMSQSMGQSIIVDNKPGAGGVVASDTVAKAAPDGLTVLLMSNGNAVSVGLFKRLPFDSRKAFAPISLLGQFDLAIVVPAASRFKSLQELLAAAKQEPGKLNIGTINIGSTQHLSAELLKLAAQVDAQVVPFNGTPAVITALRGGQIDAAVEILTPLMPQIKGQSVRPLAVLGERRSPLLPEVPTVAEGAGLKDFNVSSWNALAAPAKTPSDIVLRLARETQAAVDSAEVKKQLAALNVQPRSSSPEELAALLDSEIKRWSEVITRARIPRQ